MSLPIHVFMGALRELNDSATAAIRTGEDIGPAVRQAHAAGLPRSTIRGAIKAAASKVRRTR